MERKTKSKTITKKTVGKTKKTTEKELRRIDADFIFSIIVAIILIPSLTVFMLNLQNDSKTTSATIGEVISSSSNNQTDASEDCEEGYVEITTDKNSYLQGELLVLNIGNGTDSYIYFEPCEDLNVFEKFVDGEWVLVDGAEVAGEVNYEVSFEKKENSIDCNIAVPSAGAGVYRSVIPVYYECRQPSRYGCKSSEIFYSNEFEVIDGSVGEDCTFCSGV